MGYALRHALAWVFLAATAAPALAKPTTTTIFRFPGGKNGLTPVAGLIADSKGVLYGTTSALNSRTHKVFGTVFSLTPPSGKTGQWTQSVLWRFRGGNDGANPTSTLVMDGSGNLYGTTPVGNEHGTGTVFELSPPSRGNSNWTETTIYAFNGFQDGTYPYAGLVRTSNGVMYGINGNGGANGKGAIFQLSPPANGKGAWTESVLYSFKGGSSDGEYPQGGLFLGSDGALYGTTQWGGIDGPYCGTDGNAGCGTVFKLAPPGNGSTQWTESVLYYFTGGPGGSAPLGNVIADGSGNLFGTTNFGGVSFCCGIVFELSPPTGGGSTWSESTLYEFEAGSDGANPSAGLLLGSNGILYGTAATGGAFKSYGTVFSLTPPSGGGTTWSETTLHSFGEGNDGAIPLGNLFQGADGYLYGTTSKGGRPGHFGTVFRIAP